MLSGSNICSFSCNRKVRLRRSLNKKSPHKGGHGKQMKGVLIRYCVQIESLFWGILEADGIFLFKLSLYVINKSQE